MPSDGRQNVLGLPARRQHPNRSCRFRPTSTTRSGSGCAPRTSRMPRQHIGPTTRKAVPAPSMLCGGTPRSRVSARSFARLYGANFPMDARPGYSRPCRHRARFTTCRTSSSQPRGWSLSSRAKNAPTQRPVSFPTALSRPGRAVQKRGRKRIGSSSQPAKSCWWQMLTEPGPRRHAQTRRALGGDGMRRAPLLATRQR